MARRKGWRRYKALIALGVLAAIGVAVYLFVRQSGPEVATTTYQTEQAAMGTLSVTVAGTGNLAVRDEVEVWPKTSGTVASVKTAVGKTVKKGAVLFTIDPEDAEKATAQALASKKQAAQQYEQAKLTVTQAENELATLEDRADDPNSTVTSADIEAAEQKIDVAEAGLASAYTQYDNAKDTYQEALDAEDDLTVTAPCAGVVWTVNIEAGDTVSTSGGGGGSTSGATGTDSTGTAPVVIAKDGKLGAELSINEVDIPSIKVGQAAELTFDAVPDLTLTGEVDEIGRDGTVNQGVVTYGVWVTLDVNDKRLKTGMSTSATIVTAVARDVLLVPNSAIKTSTQGGSYVQVLDSANDTPRDVAVETGLTGSSQTVITTGLAEGVAVVTKTVTADSSGGSSGSTNQSSGRQGGEAGFFMMDAGGPPPGGRD